MIRFSCRCGKVFNISDDKAGKRGTCGKCGRTFVVPQPKIQKKATTGTGSSKSKTGSKSQPKPKGKRWGLILTAILVPLIGLAVGIFLLFGSSSIKLVEGKYSFALAITDTGNVKTKNMTTDCTLTYSGPAVILTPRYGSPLTLKISGRNITGQLNESGSAINLAGVILGDRLVEGTYTGTIKGRQATGNFKLTGYAQLDTVFQKKESARETSNSIADRLVVPSDAILRRLSYDALDRMEQSLIRQAEALQNALAAQMDEPGADRAAIKRQCKEIDDKLDHALEAIHRLQGQ